MYMYPPLSQVEPEFSREYEPTPHQLRDISCTSTVENIRCQTLMSYVSISKMTDVSIKPSFRISSAGSRFRFPWSPNPNAPQAGMSPPGKMYLSGLVGVPMAHEVAPLPIPSPGPLVGARPPYLVCLPPPDIGLWSQRCRLQRERLQAGLSTPATLVHLQQISTMASGEQWNQAGWQAARQVHN